MRTAALAVVSSVLLLSGCKGDVGATGPQGPEGPQGQQGPPGTFEGSFAGDAGFQGNANVSGDLTVGGELTLPLGASKNNPAASCAALNAARPGLPNGIYWLKPSTSAVPFEAYCEMTAEGGGWTLVWSNLRGGRGKPFTEIQWKTAINTPPRYSGTPSADLETFIVYTGLKHWTALAPNGLLRSDWAPDYGEPIDQRYICPFTFTNLTTYQITFNTASCTQPVGSAVPGLVSYSQNAAFTTYDVDNDTDATGNCATNFSNSPWWYSACFSGSIVGGGELSESYFNGACWVGSCPAWGSPGGTGAGNGWIFVK